MNQTLAITGRDLVRALTLPDPRERDGALVRFYQDNRWFMRAHGNLPTLRYYAGTWTATAMYGNSRDDLQEVEASTSDGALAKLLKVFAEIELDRAS